MQDQILNAILTELQTISGILRSQKSTTGSYTNAVLQDRIPSERDDELADKLADMYASPPLASFEQFNHNNRPEQATPPALPTIVPRAKWTLEMEDSIHKAAAAFPRTYLNSVKHVKTLLPVQLQLTSLRNKCNKLGYKIKAGYILKGETNVN